MRLLPAGLAAILGLQLLALVFFFADAGEELASAALSLHPVSELAVALALAFGTVFIARALFQSLAKEAEQRTALAVAAGEFRRVMEEDFARWGLTAAEREVARLSLGGHELDRIAEIRGAAPGTVRAQLSRIYAKSGVANRAQLSALFVEKLLGADTL
jgi:DNA-binding CsgD family transcriptional regulator